MRNLTHLILVPGLLLIGGSGVLSAQTVSVDKTSLTFSAQFQGSAVSQQLTVTSTAGAIQFSILPGAAWLKVTSFTGTTPATVTVSADPTGLNPGTYTSSLSVFGAGSATAVTVNASLTVSTIGVNPSSITFPPYTQGGTIPQVQSITLSGSGGYTATASTVTGGPWLSVNPTSGNAPGAVSAILNATILTGLATGTYQGNITITPVGTVNNTPIIVPVTLTVLPTPPVSVNPSNMVFNIQQGGTSNISSQQLTISTAAGQSLSYSFSTSYATGTPAFLTVTPPAGNTDATTGTAQVAVGYSLSGLTVGNTYRGTIVLITPGGTPVQTSIPVTLNYASGQLLNVPTNTLNFNYQLGGSAPADQTVSVTATSGTLAYAISQSANSSWLTVPNAGSTAAPFTVHVNPAGLTPGTYNATISVTSSIPGSAAQQIPVVLKVGNDPFINTNVGSMAFPFQIGQAAPASQTLKITSSTGTPLNYTASTTATTCGNNWLLLNNSTSPMTGVTDGAVSISIATAGLSAGTCSGSINITAIIASTGVPAVNSPLSIPVTLTVAATPMLVTLPSALSFSAPVGGQSPAPQTVTLSSTSGTDVLNYTITGVSQGGAPATWLSASPTSGTSSTSNVVSVFVFSGSLPAGTYNGTVTLAATTAAGAAVANSPIVIPVSLQVTSGSLTVTPSSLNFAYTLGAASPAPQTVTVGSSTGNALVFSAVATSSPANPWLSVSPSSGNTSGSGILTVSVDGTKLTTPGTVTGAITITSPNASGTQTVNVTVVVSPGTISAPTTTLSFAQAVGGSAPAAQTIAVTSSPTALNFTVTTTTTPAGGTWLSATPSTGTTPGTVSVSVNAGSLAVGQYTGQVVISSTGANGSPITVPVVLNVVSPATATASPTSLSFSYIIGQQSPAAQSLNINSSTAIPITTSVLFTGPSAAWLQVLPVQTTAPAVLSVTVQASALPASDKPYTATISIASPYLVAPLTVPVSLSVTAIPKPVVNAIGNAASYATGPIAPGENIVIFGTGIGPATLATNTPANNAYGTTVGNTRVLFDGVAAPIYYASATQTSVWVPYGVSGRTSTSIVVEYSGVQSSATSFNVVSAMPGIYTLNTQGNGPGAIYNQDGITVNSANAPEKRGNVIAVYMTGEGQTSPAGVDGAIIPPVTSALKSPLLPVTATIGGQAATVVYAGSAPGNVSGLMQVNITIPATAQTGAAVPIVVTVGTGASQNGVTVAIQ